MSLYYPQGAIILKVRWEDFGSDDPALKEVEDLPVLARSLSVEINDYNEADKFTAKIDYDSFPFDPRCIRALGVTICMEDRKGIFVKNKLDIIEPNEDNIVFLGFADESSISFDESEQTVSIEGRDFTSLLIDIKRIRTDKISLSKPVDQIIRELLDEQEATKEIEIENRTGSDLPVLSEIAPKLDPFTSVKNQKRKETYWDIIQSVISRTALVAFIDRDKLIISKPQNVYQKKDFKQFIYGGNIKSLEFSRHLGRLKNFNVKMLSLNKGKKTVLEAKIPEEATDATFIQNFGGTRNTIPQLDKDGKKIDPEKDADFIVFRVPDIADKESLIAIGETTFDEMSRQQLEGSLKTFEMEIPEEITNVGERVDTTPVVFNKIRNGTAINIYFSQGELRAINSASGKSEKVKFLVNRGYPRLVAEAFASSLNRISTPFYVKSVNFSLDQEDGFSMDLKFINFIDVEKKLVNS